MKGKGLGPCRPTLVQICWDVSQIAPGGMEMMGRLSDPPIGSKNVGTSLRWPDVEKQRSKMLGRLWDDSKCWYVSDREKCWHVSGMEQMLARLWDGAASGKCWYVSGMETLNAGGDEAVKG